MPHDERLEHQIGEELQVIREVAEMLADPKQRFSDEDRRGLAHLLRRTAQTIEALSVGQPPGARAGARRGSEKAGDPRTFRRPGSGSSAEPGTP